MATHHIIMIQGIGDDMLQMSRFTQGWKKYGYKLHMYAVPWKKERDNFPDKLDRLIEKIDTLYQTGDPISILGISAGGSIALSAFAKRKEKIDKLILVASRLRGGKHVIFPSMHFLAKAHPAFKDAILAAEKEIHTISLNDRKRIITFRGLFDELVPTSTSVIEGATNIRIPTAFHLVTHASTLLFYKKKLFAFLNS